MKKKKTDLALGFFLRILHAHGYSFSDISHEALNPTLSCVLHCDSEVNSETSNNYFSVQEKHISCRVS